MRTAMDPNWHDEDFDLWHADLQMDEHEVQRVTDEETCAAIGQLAVWEGSLAFLPAHSVSD